LVLAPVEKRFLPTIVSASTGKDPGPSAGVAVGAKRPLEKGWRTFLPTPDHEGILASVHKKPFLETRLHSCDGRKERHEVQSYLSG
jgi:hypothetical protein